ncbi:MAG: glycosyl hydrolase family 39 [Bacteroidetes bacterium]|nr:glycosyl hydrolase family 39 [Bacteroidota bacterium]
MKPSSFTSRVLILFASIFLVYANVFAQNKTNAIDWDHPISISKTTATLQLVENPMVRPSSPIHKQVFAALKELGANYVRYVPWFPYPKMAVAELKKPEGDKTFWDFTYLDSTMQAFMEATEGHPVVINFSTTPAWMWKTDSVVAYPADPYQTCWDYNQGTQLRDTTIKQLADYYVRVFSWYSKGGFYDELGKFHKSNHFYKIPYWEVLNEADFEHSISPAYYTKIYDAIVSRLKKISPETKFVGLALAMTSNPAYFEYFLNPKNHQPGVPLEGISYHHYSSPSFEGQPLDFYQYTFFEKADAFLDKVRYIEEIRKRLAPNTFTMINELGVILRSPEVSGPIDYDYWNLAGAMYAHLFLELTKLGIDGVGESQLVGYPTQFPDVTMINWENGKPNARYWVLKLLKDNFGPGDKLINTSPNIRGIENLGFITKDGEKKILLINKKNEEVKVQLPPEAKEAWLTYVDVSTRENPPVKEQLTSTEIHLRPFSVAVIKFNK